MSTENNDGKGKTAGGIPGVGNGDHGGDDWRKRAEEAEKELNKARVEQGRVKTLAQRNKELEEELAKARSAGARQALPENLREAVSDETAQAADHIARQESERVRQEVSERANKTDGQVERLRQSMIDMQIDSRFPGFRQSVDAGGELEAQWKRFLAVDGPSVVSAYEAGNIGALSILIRRFYAEADVPVPDVKEGSPIVPGPKSGAGGGTDTQHGGVSGKIYSTQEFNDANEKLSRDLARGVIDRNEYEKAGDELERALAEGRVR